MENDIGDWLPKASEKRLHDFGEDLEQEHRNEFRHHFTFQAHSGQCPPEGDWRTWLVMAGRGFGKTRAGAEWARGIAGDDGEARIALVAATLGEARSVMVEGESGLLACCTPDKRPSYEPSLRKLTFANGALAFLYGANEPESLRGPQHSHAWCDEIGKWPDAHGRAMRSWDNLLLGLRLGRDQRIVATTTPRAVALLRRLLSSEKGDGLVVTRGRTAENGFLSDRFRRGMQVEFGRSLLGRQELEGELIEEIEGALWSRALLEQCREEAASAPPTRIVIGVDPPASSRGDACGIIVCALGEDGVGRVLADCSVRRPSPERWARRVAETARAWNADRVVAEANQGGDMVRSVLQAADPENFRALPVKLVHASRGKVARAEPVAALYEAGRVRHCGQLPMLEDELCGLMAGGGYDGPSRSPDRADALVWALTELMLERKRVPRVWGL